MLRFLPTLLVLLLHSVFLSSALLGEPLEGQIVIDPAHPQWLMRQGGRHVFICGPGDPEGFLFLGQRRDDGTRDGPQEALIRKLVEHGGNCIYLQAVRSHGGDGESDENPFVNANPAKGLDGDILDQWERWFSLMDEDGILIYFFLFDDSASPFGGRREQDDVPAAEREFIEAIVRRFQHHRNLIWIIAEESEEAFSHARVRAMASIIESADQHGHLIGDHHHTGDDFKAWQQDGPLHHFAMQLNKSGDEVHSAAVAAFHKAAGRYQVIYSENTAIGTNVDDMRRFAWAAAMGGTMPMILRMDIQTTPVASLQQCSYLQQFFERSDFFTMAPHDELAHGSTAWVLADPGRSAVAYTAHAKQSMGVKRLPAEHYELSWLDCVSGRQLEQQVDHSGGHAAWSVPPGFGNEVAVWMRIADRQKTSDFPRKHGQSYYPPPESQGGWRKLEKPDDIRRLSGFDPQKLESLQRWLRASDNRDFAAVVIRHGYIALEVERGKSSKTDVGNVKSVAKAICATVLAIAANESQQGRLPKRMSFADSAFEFIPWAQPLSDPRKANIKVKQLLNHTSGIAPESTGARNRGPWEYVLGHSGDERTARLAFSPGTDLGYSTHGLYHAALVCENVAGMPYDQYAITRLLEPIGCTHWWFEFFAGGESYGRHPSHALGMPARDLARIAYCMLREGRWDDTQVVPRWFVRETGAPTHAVTGQKSFDRDAQSWSHGWELPARLTDGRGRGIPADARFKPGSGGQLIAFVPSLDLVITRQTGSSGGWEYEEFLRRACAAVVAAGPH